jgi:SAM-dependent methyltransferase
LNPPTDILRRSLGALKRRINRRPLSPVSQGAADFWDAQAQTRKAMYWAEYPQVRGYVNQSITGVPWLWPVNALKVGWMFRAVDRGLSLGCGTGALERSLFHLHICERADAYDVSPEAIREARLLAKKEKVRGVRYRVADCDLLRLPANRYDIAFFHGSLHHISDPDRLLGEVERSLRPHGLLYIDDYIGPSRDEWTDEHLAPAREEMEKMPDELKLWPVNPPLDYRDPSEMIRSSRIRPALLERFDIVHERPYWGNLLFPMLCCLDGDAMARAENAPLLERMIQRERELVQDGTFRQALFSVFLLRKKA